jgi:hypothetical protein
VTHLLALLFAAAKLTSATPTPTPVPERPYIIVQKDGTQVRLKKAPVPSLKGNGLVGSLWPKGELFVMVRRDDVDEKRTAEANRLAAQAPWLDATVIAQRTDVAGPKASLGDRVKLVKTRAEAEKMLRSASGTGKKKAPGKSPDEDLPERAEPGSQWKAGSEGAEAGTAEAGEILDKDGRNEAYWRAKAERAKNELADAEGELRLALHDQDRHERSMPAPGQGAAATWAMELQRLRDAVDRGRVRVENAKRRLEDLTEAARVARAFPGWVR